MKISIATPVRMLAAASLLGAGLTAVATPAGAATQVLGCTGLSQIVSMNPPTGSAGSKYLKWAVKDSDGSKFDLFGASIAADGFTCAVDSGIRTPNTATNSASGKANPFDDQTAGAATLTTSGGLAKTVMSLSGSGTCRSELASYPSAYPVQGKVTTKFDQFDANAKQIQMQSYVRLGADAADPEGDLTVSGVVIKGPGVGGEVRATVALFPTNSTKNLNVGDCIAATPVGDASVVEMKLSQADGSDSDSLVDPWEVVLP